ncbi:hypothetical protein GCM10022214_75370 [Actinomadura miaoliensis]|uniref:Uncharacterized protein n=1 Tax=Actinomadura miaoliensis TaxID=430685 RepID=A0ABP7WXG6_9ACTN
MAGSGHRNIVIRPTRAQPSRYKVPPDPPPDGPPYAEPSTTVPFRFTQSVTTEDAAPGRAATIAPAGAAAVVPAMVDGRRVPATVCGRFRRT